MLIDGERAEIVLAVRIIVGVEFLKVAHPGENASQRIVTQAPNASGDDDHAAGESDAELVIERTNAAGLFMSLDGGRCGGRTGFSIRCKA